jgi:hypothetical protein
MVGRQNTAATKANSRNKKFFRLFLFLRHRQIQD